MAAHQDLLVLTNHQGATLTSPVGLLLEAPQAASIHPVASVPLIFLEDPEAEVLQGVQEVRFRADSTDSEARLASTQEWTFPQEVHLLQEEAEVEAEAQDEVILVEGVEAEVLPLLAVTAEVEVKLLIDLLNGVLVAEVQVAIVEVPTEASEEEVEVLHAKHKKDFVIPEVVLLLPTKRLNTMNPLHPLADRKSVV